MENLTIKQSAALAAVFGAALILLVKRALDEGAFSSPATYLGIAVGVAIATTAWVVGKRARDKRTRTR